ncbi:MAG: glycosyl hydrolase [Planctomycetota bacterium]
MARTAGAQSLSLVDLSGPWAFRTDPQAVGEKEGWATPELDDRAWQQLNVPATWESQGVTQSYPGMPCPQISEDLRQKGVPNAYNGVAWYRRWIEVPKDWQGKDLVLLMGGVDDRDQTYLNGQEIGRTGEGAPHPSTLPRRYTIPAQSVREGRNLLAVRVYDGGGPGGIHGGPVVLLPKDALDHVAENRTMKPKDLRERFESPPNDRRILKIIHNFPAKKDSHEALLVNLLCQGFGGIVCNVHFKDYLRSEENWQSFVHGVRMAKGLGMALWLYDEQGYPSGAAGGITLEGHPEWEAIGLLAVDVPLKKGPVNVTLPEGPVVFAKACPVRDKALDLKAAVDLAGRVANRTLQWEAPDDQWRLIAFVRQPMLERTHAALNLYANRPYINLLMREPTLRFIELTHQEYAKRLPELRDLFEATFTDEPSLMSVFLPPGSEYAPLPWSPTFAAEFQRRKGYDLIPLLPALAADVGPETGKVRCDFWDTVGQLTTENFFLPIRDWCRQHGVPSGGHLLAEEDVLNHCAYYGDFFACVRKLDAPSIDCLTSIPSSVQWHIAKMIASIAALENRPITMSETSDHAQQYRRPEDKRERYIVSPDEIRGTCNRLYVGGINTITSYYRWQNISVSELRAINEYVGRCGVMLTGGETICDIALYYPMESVWAHYIPSRHGVTQDATARKIAKTFRDLSYTLFQSRRDFAYVDDEAFRQAAVSDGRLRMGALNFRVLVLPHVDVVPLDVWRKVAEFHAAGGVVIAAGAIPTNSTGAFPCEETSRLSRQIFGEVADATIKSCPHPSGGLGVFVSMDYARWIPRLLDRIIDPDFSTNDAASPLRYTHRRLEGKDLYFVINDSPNQITEAVSTCGEGPAEVWDPSTGQLAPWTGNSQTLGPYRGVFLCYADCRQPKRRAAVDIETALTIQETPLGDVIQPLPAFAPGVPAHVAASVVNEPPAGLRAESTIKEGERDCWSFPRAAFDLPIDLSRFAGLSFRSFAPEGQQDCGAELLVSMVDADGANYLARTGRGLSASGWQTSTVWFDAFHPLGRAPDPNGRLDLDKIQSISIGWGGYHGRTGERIVYTISDIRFVSVP